MNCGMWIKADTKHNKHEAIENDNFELTAEWKVTVYVELNFF